MESKYINKTNAAGIHITEGSPIDDRKYIDTIASIEDLSAEEPFPGIMYDGMVIQVADTRQEYVWVESAVGIMQEGYTYPEYLDDVQGQNYANKTYNLVLYDRVNKLTLVYDDTLKDGIFIANKYLPYHVLNDRDTAQITMKSNKTSYSEVEWPDRIRVDSGGIMVILDPKPILSEKFKITIS